MKLLIIGGTRFLGRHFVEHLLEKYSTEIDITLFNRGNTNPDLFPEVRKIVGDRSTDDIQKIGGENWDVVIDFSNYYPVNLEKTLSALDGKVGRYVYISTVSVYDAKATLGQLVTEEFPILPCPIEERDAKQITGKNYGFLKAESERVLLANEQLDKIILRPSIVYGKYDYTDRVYSWIYRVKNRDNIVLPEGCEAVVAHTFIEDLTKILEQSLIIKKHRTVYNVNTHHALPIKDMFMLVSKLLNKEVTWTDITLEDLKAKNTNISQAFPSISFEHLRSMNYSHEKLLTDFDLELDSFETSYQKTIDYYASLGWQVPAVGIRSEEEDTLLDELA